MEKISLLEFYEYLDIDYYFHLKFIFSKEIF